MRKRAGSVAEISVFPTGISESGLKVAIWTETNFISVTEPARLTGIMWRGPETPMTAVRLVFFKRGICSANKCLV